MKLFNPETGKSVLEWYGHKNTPILSLNFSPDGNLLASSSSDKITKIWDAYTGELKQYLDHNGSDPNVKFLSDSRLLSHSHGMIELWDIQTGQKIKSLPLTRKGFFATISDNGRLLVTAATSEKGLIRIWNADTLEPIRTIPIENPPTYDRISCIAISPTNTQLAISVLKQDSSKENWINLISLDSSESSRILVKQEKTINSLAYSRTGLLAFSNVHGKEIYIWNLCNNQPCKILNKSHDHEGMKSEPIIHSLTFSPNDRYIVSGSYDKIIDIFDLTKKVEEKKEE